MEGQNVSDTKLPEVGSIYTKQIERAKREWEVTVDVLPQLICVLDHQKHILRANRTIERWQLGYVIDVKGQEIHKFLHTNCLDSSCYLLDFLEQAWQKLTQGQAVTLEAEDELLNRYLHLQVHPLLSQTSIKNGDTASFAVLVLDDITDRKQAEAALHKYTLALKARNQELDAFAHTVAHDLKGPLLPLIGSAEMLKNFYHKIPLEQTLKDLEVITRSGLKMSKIIDELLLLAGVRNMDVEMEPLDMAAIIAEVEQRLDYMIEEYQAELVIPPMSTWPVALGYGPWVEEVWVNYLNNAIKYGGRPPRLELGVDPPLSKGGMARFWIHDNGPGLKPEEQTRLFTPFTQLEQVQINGHGLGLSIVRRIVEKLNGQVSVESEGIPGQGCTFSFTLPTV